ncbi:MAG TPA: cupin domain-containing protein [Pyrinomonadaceae bacterium]|jgi:quercetin dioxygenase-like cupin family protein|nr:cupin domain-containing protein [Pyrinomonadaceae bacterium]
MSNNSSDDTNGNRDGNGNGEPNGSHGLGRHLNWSNIPVEQVSDGIERQMLVGHQMMICRFRFQPFLVTPEHDHPHEQMTIVERGKVRFFIEGKEQIAKAGDVLHFPPQCWHGATMMDEEVVLLDFFTPVREDFL